MPRPVHALTLPRSMVTLIALAAGTSSAWSAPIHVPADFPTLQAAVDAAAPGDVITLAPGNYTQTVIIGKALTIDGGGAATLDGTGADTSIITVDSVTNGVVHIRGLTIRNGNGTTVDSSCWPFGPSPFGGGVRIVASTVTLTSTLISSNRATLGGGLWYEQGSNVTIDSCTFDENFASEIAAAVGGCWFGAPNTLTVRNSTISANTLLTSGSQYGILTPGIGSATLTGTTFSANSETLGVVHTPQNAPVRLTVSDCTFRDNSRIFGSITVFQVGPLASALVERSNFDNEQGGLPGGRGGVFIVGTGPNTATVRDCTFRNVITNGVEPFLSAGASALVERCRMTEMPDGSVGGAATSGSSITVRDVQGSGGDEGMPWSITDGSTLRMSRVSMINTRRNAITVTLGGGSTVDLSNILATGAGVNGLQISTVQSGEPGVPQEPNQVRMINMTLALNFIGLQMGGADSGNFILANSIIADNTETNFLPGLEPGIPQTRNTIINSFLYPGATNVEPRFINAAAGNFRLAPDSPAIDAGDNSALLVDDLLDFDGNARRVDNPVADTGLGTAPLVDIGAFEVQNAPVLPARCSPADIAYGNGDPLPPFGPATGFNPGVDGGDFDCFFNFYFEPAPGNAVCDIAYGNGDPLPPFGPATGFNPGVDGGDFDCFFNFYFSGCI